MVAVVQMGSKTLRSTSGATFTIDFGSDWANALRALSRRIAGAASRLAVPAPALIRVRRVRPVLRCLDMGLLLHCLVYSNAGTAFRKACRRCPSVLLWLRRSPRRSRMSRKLGVAVAQLGPIHLA